MATCRGRWLSVGCAFAAACQLLLSAAWVRWASKDASVKAAAAAAPLEAVTDFDLPVTIPVLPQFETKLRCDTNVLYTGDFPPNTEVLHRMLSDLVRLHPEWESLNMWVHFHFQFEHLIVLPSSATKDMPSQASSQDIAEAAKAFYGQSLSARSIDGTGEAYRTRLNGCYVREDFCNASRDIIIEYAVPNLAALREGQAVPTEVLKSVVYIPSMPYNLYRERHGRDPSVVITTWNEVTLAKDYRPRRRNMLQRLQQRNIQVRNMVGFPDCSSKLRDMLRSTAIMLNVHQTDFHHTVEEFRLLPAILCGVVVISEVVPYMSEIPWKDYVVWATAEEFPSTVEYVQANYATVFDSFFGPGSKLPNVLHGIWRHWINVTNPLLLWRYVMFTPAKKIVLGHYA